MRKLLTAILVFAAYTLGLAFNATSASATDHTTSPDSSHKFCNTVVSPWIGKTAQGERCWATNALNDADVDALDPVNQILVKLYASTEVGYTTCSYCYELTVWSHYVNGCGAGSYGLYVMPAGFNDVLDSGAEAPNSQCDTNIEFQDWQWTGVRDSQLGLAGKYSPYRTGLPLNSLSSEVFCAGDYYQCSVDYTNYFTIQ